MRRKYRTPHINPITDEELKKRFEDKPVSKQGKARIRELMREYKNLNEQSRLHKGTPSAAIRS